MEKHYDVAVIGSGAGGLGLARTLAGEGKNVILVEQDADNLGGNCPNRACLPTKLLLHLSQLCPARERPYGENAERFRQAILEKDRFTAQMRQGSRDSLERSGVTLAIARAAFATAQSLHLHGEIHPDNITADTIVLDTGSSAALPDIPGLAGCRLAYTSQTLIDRKELPEHLLILGGGYVSLEYAAIYRNFGSQVTILHRGSELLPKEDPDIAHAIAGRLEELGIKLCLGVSTRKVEEENGEVVVTVNSQADQAVYRGDVLLVATGRRPNTRHLHPEKAGLELTEKGGIVTDKHRRTVKPHIYVLGDVAGEMEFTYISTDDSRIVHSAITGKNDRSTDNRGAIPFCTFFDPPFARVGMTEQRARETGAAVEVVRIKASDILKALVLGRGRGIGLVKAVVDPGNKRLLGMHMFCEESHEMISLAKLVIDREIPYDSLGGMIIPHPTMSELFNSLT